MDAIGGILCHPVRRRGQILPQLLTDVGVAIDHQVVEGQRVRVA